MQVNLLGQIWVLREFLPAMIKMDRWPCHKDQGHIVDYDIPLGHGRDRDQDHELRMITRIRMRMRVRICLPAMIRPDRLILEGCTPAMLHIPRCCKYKPPWTLHIPIKYLSYILYVPFIYPSYTLVYTLHIPILYHLYTFHIHILYPLYTLHIPAPYPNILFIHWWRIMVNISHFCRSTFPFVLFQNLMHTSLSS